jgi:hypothetical protein
VRVFITGATGFIGTHLIQRLAHDGHELCCLVRKTSDTLEGDQIAKAVDDIILGDPKGAHLLLQEVFCDTRLDQFLWTALFLMRTTRSERRRKSPPRPDAEFEDSALLKSFGQAGEGFFAIPTVVEEEVARQYEVEASRCLRSILSDTTQ